MLLQRSMLMIIPVVQHLRLTVDADIDMKDRYRIKNLITPQDYKDPATKYYVDNTFLDTDGSYPMKGNLNMNNNKIVGLNNPTSNTDAATKKYVDDNSGVDDITQDLDLKYTLTILRTAKREHLINWQQLLNH